MIGWCTEAADNLVVGRVAGETNKGHSFFIIVGCPVFMAMAVSNACPASCPSAEDAALMAVDDRVVQESTALGRPPYPWSRRIAL